MRVSQAVIFCLLVAVVSSVSSGCGRQRGRPASAPNALPLGGISEPREGMTVAPVFTITGWAGDDVGIRALRVLIDGRLVALASFVVDRPDVIDVYPQLRHGTSRLGYQASVDAGAPGPHTLRLDAVDSDGATATLGTVRILVVSR